MHYHLNNSLNLKLKWIFLGDRSNDTKNETFHPKSKTLSLHHYTKFLYLQFFVATNLPIESLLNFPITRPLENF